MQKKKERDFITTRTIAQEYSSKKHYVEDIRMKSVLSVTEETIIAQSKTKTDKSEQVENNQPILRK